MELDDSYQKGGSPINRTDAALMGRGLDRALAAKLRKEKWTLSKLKVATDAKLKALGLSQRAVKAIRAGARSEVPFASLASVLIANRFTCCVCRDPEKSIVVHHIEEWAVSHDHSPANLCVVCLQHHDRAHTKSELSRNLTPDLIRESKRRWEDAVRLRDAQAIIQASRTRSDTWLYFNHIRLFELARSLKINLRDLSGYKPALRAGHIDTSGTLKKRSQAYGYMYEGGDGTTLYHYVRDVLEAIFNRVTVLNVSDLLNGGLLAALTKSGDFILLQGLTSFSHPRRAVEPEGPGQTATGTRTANNVKVSFHIDRWEATSSSARNVWLRGSNAVATVMRLVKIETKKGKTEVQGTALAIAHGLDEMKTREYSNMPFRRGVDFLMPGEQDEMDDSWLDEEDEG